MHIHVDIVPSKLIYLYFVSFVDKILANKDYSGFDVV